MFNAHAEGPGRLGPLTPQASAAQRGQAAIPKRYDQLDMGATGENPPSPFPLTISRSANVVCRVPYDRVCVPN